MNDRVQRPRRYPLLNRAIEAGSQDFCRGGVGVLPARPGAQKSSSPP